MISILGDYINNTIPYIDYINLGVIVAVLAAILTRRLIPAWAYDEQVAAREKAELQREKAELQVEALRQKIEDDVLPQLFSTTNVLAKVYELKTPENK